MKQDIKSVESPSSTTDDSPPQRPKRNSCQKNMVSNNGLLWREETDLKRALYASLQESRKRTLEDGDTSEIMKENEEEGHSSDQMNSSRDPSPKRTKVHAQRKFAQLSTPNSPLPSPNKLNNASNSASDLLPYRRPKTEDFLTFLCLRGTTILPPSLDFLNICSKSDTSSDSRCASPDSEYADGPPTRESSLPKLEGRAKNSSKPEAEKSEPPRKHAPCKASAARPKPEPAKASDSQKSQLSQLKSAKELMKKKKMTESGDGFHGEYFARKSVLPSSAKMEASQSRTLPGNRNSSSMNALREKYKQKRLAASKKPLPSVSSAAGARKIPTKVKKHIASVIQVTTRNQTKTVRQCVLKSSLTRSEQKLALEKRRSLRSAQARPTRILPHRKPLYTGKNTPWLRKAKLVPPVVDVESESEPEVITTIPASKSKATSKMEEQRKEKSPTPMRKAKSVPDQQRARKIDTSKPETKAQCRNIRQVGTKRPILPGHNKLHKPSAIIKSSSRIARLKKLRKGFVTYKTMSLRNDPQITRRVTRSAMKFPLELPLRKAAKHAVKSTESNVSRKNLAKKPEQADKQASKGKVFSKEKEISKPPYKKEAGNKDSKESSKNESKESSRKDSKDLVKTNAKDVDRKSPVCTRSREPERATGSKSSQSPLKHIKKSDKDLDGNKSKEISQQKSPVTRLVRPNDGTKPRLGRPPKQKPKEETADRCASAQKRREPFPASHKKNEAAKKNETAEKKSSGEAAEKRAKTDFQKPQDNKAAPTKTDANLPQKADANALQRTEVVAVAKKSGTCVPSRAGKVENTPLKVLKSKEGASESKREISVPSNAGPSTGSKDELNPQSKSDITAAHKSQESKASCVPKKKEACTLKTSDVDVTSLTPLRCEVALTSSSLEAYAKKSDLACDNGKGDSFASQKPSATAADKTEADTSANLSVSGIASKNATSASSVELPDVCSEIQGRSDENSSLCEDSTQVDQSTEPSTCLSDAKAEITVPNDFQKSKDRCAELAPSISSEPSKKEAARPLTVQEKGKEPSDSSSFHQKTEIMKQSSPVSVNKCAELSSLHVADFVSLQESLVSLPAIKRSSLVHSEEHVHKEHVPSSLHLKHEGSVTGAHKVSEKSVHSINSAGSAVSRSETVLPPPRSFATYQKKILPKPAPVVPGASGFIKPPVGNFPKLPTVPSKDASQILSSSVTESNIVVTSVSRTVASSIVSTQPYSSSSSCVVSKKEDQPRTKLVSSSCSVTESGTRSEHVNVPVMGVIPQVIRDAMNISAGVEPVHSLPIVPTAIKAEHEEVVSCDSNSSYVVSPVLAFKSECPQVFQELADFSHSRQPSESFTVLGNSFNSLQMLSPQPGIIIGDHVPASGSIPSGSGYPAGVVPLHQAYSGHLSTHEASAAPKDLTTIGSFLRTGHSEEQTAGKVSENAVHSGSASSSNQVVTSGASSEPESSQGAKKGSEAVGGYVLSKKHSKDVHKFLKDGDKKHKSGKSGSKEGVKSKKKSAKELSKSKKDGGKDHHKIKKEGEKDGSKHKSHEKESSKGSGKKDDLLKPHKKDSGKVKKKESDRDHSKLLKKEVAKDKSKLSLESSSSLKSSKHDSDRDSSKSSKKESDHESLFAEKLGSTKNLLDGKKEKDKSSKKLSPKKKKKREHKDLEKISKSLLLGEPSALSKIADIKAFKRRGSGEKSQLKKLLSKSKKRKKLELLKAKKLSKKLSSKLLRKYAKKKGLKLKKSKLKLKKKELKKEGSSSKSSSQSEKSHHKTKKQKHKNKGEHHKKDSHSKASSQASEPCTKVLPLELAAAVRPLYREVPLHVTSASTSTAVTESIGTTSASPTINTSSIGAATTSFVTENVPENVATIETMTSDLPQTVQGDLVFSTSDDLQGIVASDFSSVFDETFASGAILLATSDSIAQVPVHFIPEITPKTVADAATNTSDDDLVEERTTCTEVTKSEETSVGTQTITPAGSPSPTLELNVPGQQPAPHKPDPSAPVKEGLKSPATGITKTALTPTDNIKAVSSVKSSDKTESPTKDAEKHPLVANSIKSGAIPDTKNVVKDGSVEKDNTKSLPVARDNPKVSPLSKSGAKSLSSAKDSTSASSPKGKSKASQDDQQGASPAKKRKMSCASFKKLKPQSCPCDLKRPFPGPVPCMIDAPVYSPSLEEFQDPLEYIEKIKSEAEKFGICKIVPPPSFKPECKVNDDMRFTAHNQYVHKMLNRWGPNVQHVACIKKHLKSQKVQFDQAPLIGGIELDLSKFYHTVQQFGGLQQVIEKKKWQKVADSLHIPKAAQDRVTKLYDAYCKYLVSYETLPLEEKKKLEEDVIAEHEQRLKLQNNIKENEKEESEDMDDEENTDCVTKGRSMTLSNFFRVARNTMSMWHKKSTNPEEVEYEAWKLITDRLHHVVVHAGNIDSSVYQSGFPCNRNSPFAKHPWNLKVLTNNPNSILRCMGPVSGVTIPTLHVGMLFTIGCWYRDPHSLPWIEYLHTGASKIWYGIPAKCGDTFRESMKTIMPEYCGSNPIWLASDTAMVPPDILVQNGVSLSRTIQHSGQFIVIFPESFTSTICSGYCVSESVYFAPPSWLELAQKAFKDIRNSCEPPAFSLERLLFCIANDPKTVPETLQKILPMLERIRDEELELRSKLLESGLKQMERLPLLEVKDKKKKRGVEDECEQECEVCRAHCYVSMVLNTAEDSIYCLHHAVEHIEKKDMKSCKLLYTYDETDLHDLVKKTTELINAHLQKIAARKKLQKKKVPSTPEK